jgi:hypothetical protein
VCLQSGDTEAKDRERRKEGREGLKERRRRKEREVGTIFVSQQK